MVLAEKIVTAIERGTANTRWRDFADIYLLTGAHTVPAATIRRAIQTVASHRNAALRPLHAVHEGYADLGRARWAAWRRKQNLNTVLPEQFQDVLTSVWSFTDQLLESEADRVWHPEIREWQ